MRPKRYLTFGKNGTLNNQKLRNKNYELAIQFNLTKLMKILFNPDDGSTGGGSSTADEKVTLTKAEHEKLVKDSNEFIRLKNANVKTESRIKELEGSVKTLADEKENIKQKFTALEQGVKQQYYEQLSDEHKKIAELIPTIEGLRDYVSLNAAKPPAGSDSARPGSGGAELTAKWDELSYNEKEDLRKKRPELWKKLYREKFGFNN